MLSNIKNMYKSLGERLETKKYMLFFEGIIIILLGIIALIFDNHIGTISVNYLLPISYIIFAFNYLVIAYKVKNDNNFSYIIYLIGSLILLILPLFIVFNPITTKVLFIEFIGVIFIIKNVIDFIAITDKAIFETIKNTVFVFIGLLIIILSSYLANTYITLLIVLITIGLIKIVTWFLVKNVYIKK